MGIFKKMNLSENLKIFKKSDKDIYCANCGIRTGVITRQTLKDDRCLCVNCQNALPSYYMNKYHKMTAEEYGVIYTYITGESKELKKKFKKKHSFIDLHLDTANGILCYKPANSVPLYVKLENISHFALDCKTSCFQGSSALVVMTLECKNPYIFIHEALALPGTNYECEVFMEHCNFVGGSRQNNNYKQYDEHSNNNQNEPVTEDAQLQKALAMFMFDSIEDVTAEKLKTQRNRLIKSFHPDANSDEDTRYAQKINEAYDLLHKYVK